MTLGLAERQGVLFDDVTRFCDEVVPAASVYALLHRERDRLFPDELFADLFSDRGRRSVPPSVVATVMVLQRLEGLSDREAVATATSIWTRINLRNLHENIQPTRRRADLILKKGDSHLVEEVALRRL